MAALIDGFTCDRACKIPFDLDGRDQGDRQEVGESFLTFANARFLLADEVSMISVELDATVERLIRAAIAATGKYKRRADGSLPLSLEDSKR